MANGIFRRNQVEKYIISNKFVRNGSNGAFKAIGLRLIWSHNAFGSTHLAALVTRCRVLACKEDRTADKRCCKMGHRTAGNSRW